MKKKFIILISICLIIFIIFVIFYHLVINPIDDLGMRCQTFYNRSEHYLPLIGNVQILENSCFVSDCCEYTSNFRTKMEYEELKIKAKDLENKLNNQFKDKNLNYNVEVNAKDGKFFREYSIFYYSK